MEYTPQDIGDINANLREYTPQDITDINVEMDESTGMRLISPAKGAVGVSTSPVLQWESFEGSPLIRVLVWDDDGSGVDGSVGQPNNLIIDAKIVGSATEYNIPEALQNDSWYHWRTVPTADITPVPSDPVVDEITGISISQGSIVTEGSSREFDISFTGNGDFSTVYTASIVSGAGTISQSGNQVTVTANANSHPGTITFEVRSDTNIDVFSTRELSIQEALDPTVQDDSLQGDRDSLQLIYDNLGGENWYTTWNTNTIQNGSLSNLHGIETDSDGRVTELNLITNNLRGIQPEFPGLQRMWRYYVSQTDDTNPVALDALDRIHGPLPSSLGHTSVTHLALSSIPTSGGGPIRLIEDWNNTGINKKFGQVANKYSGGVPESWQNLTLEYLDIAGQSLDWGFEARFEPWMSNWNIKRIICHGDRWRGNNGGWFGPVTKAAIGTWVDCDLIYADDNNWESCDLDAFVDWNNLPRVIDFSIGDNNAKPHILPRNQWNHPFPDSSSNTLARRLNYNKRGLNGEYPAWIHSFTNLNEILLSDQFLEYNGDVLPSFAPMVGTTSKFELNNSGNDMNTAPPYRMNGKVFSDGENVSGYFNNRIILFYAMRNPGMGGQIPEGMEDWTRLRFLLMNRCDYYGNLPNGCPGYDSSRIRGISFSGTRIGPNFPTDNTTWELAGRSNFNGTVTTSGKTVTRVSGDDFSRSNVGDFIYIDFEEYIVESKSSNQELTVTVEPPTHSSAVPFVNHQGFDGGVAAGGYALQLRDMELSDVVPAVWANMRITGGDGINVSDNKLTFQHLIHAPAFANNGKSWGLTYAPQKPFGKESDQSGDTIDLSAYHQSGNDYVWKRNGTVLSGETSHTITTSGVGNEYVCEVTNEIAPDLTLISITFNT